MVTVAQTGLDVADIKPAIASRVLTGKAELLTGRHSEEIRDLLERRGVIVFPGIHMDDDEQVAFTRTLGETARERTGEEVFTVSLDPEKSSGVEYLKGAFYWHFDGVIQAKPILASILSAKVLPPSGGDTEFCNTYAAYDLLPEEEKKQIEGLRAMHSAWTSLFYYEPEPSYAKLEEMIRIGEVELPLVWKHRSGRKSLVLGCTAHHVIGMSPTQSTRLLVRLRDWATQPRFVYSHEWSVGDAVMWDNTGTMHRAMPYDPDCGRLLHRTKTEGEEPIV